MKRFKICYVGDCFPPFDVGGAEIQMYREATGICDLGHEVIVISVGGHPAVSRNKQGMKVYHLPLPRHTLPSSIGKTLKALGVITSIWNPVNMNRVGNILKEEQPDIVHTQHIPYISYSCMRMVDRIRSKLVHTFHGYQFECLRGSLYNGNKNQFCHERCPPCRIYKQIFDWLIPRPDAVIAPSNFMKKRLISAGYPEEIVKVIFQAIEVRDEFIPPKREEVLFVGRITHAKGLRDLIAAARVIDDPTVTWRVVGDGPDLNYYRDSANEMDNMIFEGRVPNEDLNMYYQQARVVVVPSRWPEVLNTVICEAMSCGRPVVATDVGGNSDMIVDGVTGLLVPVGRADLIAKALQNALSKNISEEMGKNALKQARKFDVKLHNNKIMNLYSSLLSQ